MANELHMLEVGCRSYSVASWFERCLSPYSQVMCLSDNRLVSGHGSSVDLEVPMVRSKKSKHKSHRERKEKNGRKEKRGKGERRNPLSLNRPSDLHVSAHRCLPNGVKNPIPASLLLYSLRKAEIDVFHPASTLALVQLCGLHHEQGCRRIHQ